MTKQDSVPETDDTKAIGKLHGLDRSGLGKEGWAEVPEDLIGGHPELEETPAPDQTGGLNGPQPRTDAATGAVASSEKKREN